MKTLILLATLIIGSNAEASFYQTTCSNADQTVKYATGHVDNGVELTETQMMPGQYGKVEFDLSEVKIERSESNIIVQETRGGCPSGAGYWAKTTTYTEVLKISKKDGTQFRQRIHHLSDDNMTVEVRMICESHISSRVACPQS